MASWPTNEEREIALVMGKQFQRSIGWKSEFFLPQDHLHVIANGPRFQSMDGDDLFENSLDGIKKDLRIELPDDFWQQIAERAFQDAEWTFWDVVGMLLKKKEVS